MIAAIISGVITVIGLCFAFVKYLLNGKDKRISELEKKNESLTNQLIKRSRGGKK